MRDVRLPAAGVARAAAWGTAMLLALTTSALAQEPPPFANGPPTDPSWFPIGVWLQAPDKAAGYRAIGINLYVGLWEGPTEPQLAGLAKAGMRVICEQNAVGLGWSGKEIIGWMQKDEPDNAQGRRLTGYRPPIEPWQVVEYYEALHRVDPTRPVLLNLGQGVAFDGWHGRGGRSGHSEDYPEYLKGCDLASFDIYPVTHRHPDVRGRLEFVARGVERLRRWSGGHVPVWACIGTTHVDDAERRPTPLQIEQQVWIAIAAGADGIVYFAHQFAPHFVEAGLLANADTRGAVARVDADLLAVAPVLHAPRTPDAARVRGPHADRIALRAHRHEGALHLFVASLDPAEQTFECELADAALQSVRSPLRVGELPVSPGGADATGPSLATLTGGVLRERLPGYGCRHYVLTAP